MKVFLCGTSFHDSYGGPAYSVARLAAALSARGIDVALWAPDGSAVSAADVPPQIRRFGGPVYSALGEFGKPDVIHDNGLWRPHNHRLARLAFERQVPRIVSIRGMLEPWALRHKAMKKWVGWRVYQRRDLAVASCHHATAESEAAQIRALNLGVRVCVIPNGIDLPPERPRGEAAAVELRTALFLSRIHPKKGLLMLVEAWARVRPRGWRLRIVGPDDSHHRSQVERAVAHAGLSAEVCFAGPVAGAAKMREFFDADLFVLPSHSENFGLVVAEALAHDLPVITTTATPWNIVNSLRCGWCVPPDAHALVEALRQATALDREALRSMGRHGRELVASRFSWPDVARQFQDIYADARAA